MRHLTAAKNYVKNNKLKISAYFIGMGIFIALDFAAFDPLTNEATSEAEAFCDDHRDICDLYQQDSSLPTTIEKTLSISPMTHTARGGLAFLILLGAWKFIEWAIRKSAPQESRSLIVSDRQFCTCQSFFKIFKEKIIGRSPHKFFWIVTSVLCSVLSVAHSINIANTASENICPSSGCDAFFPNATDSQIQEISEFDTGMYDALLGIGIPLDLSVAIAAILSLMALFTFVKHREIMVPSEAYSNPLNSEYSTYIEPDPDPKKEVSLN